LDPPGPRLGQNSGLVTPAQLLAVGCFWALPGHCRGHSWRRWEQESPSSTSLGAGAHSLTAQPQNTAAVFKNLLWWCLVALREMASSWLLSLPAKIAKSKYKQFAPALVALIT